MDGSQTVSYSFYPERTWSDWLVDTGVSRPTEVLKVQDPERNLYEITREKGMFSEDWTVKFWKRNGPGWKNPYPEDPTQIFTGERAREEALRILESKGGPAQILPHLFKKKIEEFWDAKIKPKVLALQSGCSPRSLLSVCEQPSARPDAPSDRLALRLGKASSKSPPALQGLHVYFHSEEIYFSFSVDLENDEDWKRFHPALFASAHALISKQNP